MVRQGSGGEAEPRSKNNGADVMFALCSFTNCKQPLCFLMLLPVLRSMYVCVCVCFKHCNAQNPNLDRPQHGSTWAQTASTPGQLRVKWFVALCFPFVLWPPLSAHSYVKIMAVIVVVVVVVSLVVFGAVRACYCSWTCQSIKLPGWREFSAGKQVQRK